MSGKMMGAVFDLQLDAPEMLILLALADHADHDGRNIRPRLGYVAWKTGYSERQVRRIVRKLEGLQILRCQGHATGGRHRSTLYRMDISHAPRKSPYKDTEGDDEAKPGQNDLVLEEVYIEEGITVKGGQNDRVLNPDKMTGFQQENPDIAVSQNPDIAVSPQPSRTVRKEEDPPIIPPLGDGRSCIQTPQTPQKKTRTAEWTPDQMIDRWNALAATYQLPHVMTRSEKRRARIHRILRQYPTRAFWEEVFAEYPHSQFLLGRTPPRPGHERFKADLDWLLSVGKSDGVENYIKVREGKFRDPPAAPPVKTCTHRSKHLLDAYNYGCDVCPAVIPIADDEAQYQAVLNGGMSPGEPVQVNGISAHLHASPYNGTPVRRYLG